MSLGSSFVSWWLMLVEVEENLSDQGLSDCEEIEMLKVRMEFKY